MMQAQSTVENSNTTFTVTRQQKMNAQAQARRERCRLLRLSPLICVLLGSILTVVGHTASITICKIVGPVVMCLGGLVLVFMTIWSSKEDRAPQSEGTTPSCEVDMAGYVSKTVPKEPSYQLGPIHHVEVWIPPETVSPPEIVPPSYEEATSDSKDSLHEEEENTKNLSSEPPSYEDRHGVESQSVEQNS